MPAIRFAIHVNQEHFLVMDKTAKPVSLVMPHLILEPVLAYPAQLVMEIPQIHLFVVLVPQDLHLVLERLVHRVFLVMYRSLVGLVFLVRPVMVILITLVILQFVLLVLEDRAQMTEVNVFVVKKGKSQRVEDFVSLVTQVTNPTMTKLLVLNARKEHFLLTDRHAYLVYKGISQLQQELKCAYLVLKDLLQTQIELLVLLAKLVIVQLLEVPVRNVKMVPQQEVEAFAKIAQQEMEILILSPEPVYLVPLDIVLPLEVFV